MYHFHRLFLCGSTEESRPEMCSNITNAHNSERPISGDDCTTGQFPHVELVQEVPNVYSDIKTILCPKLHALLTSGFASIGTLRMKKEVMFGLQKLSCCERKFQ